MLPNCVPLKKEERQSQQQHSMCIRGAGSRKVMDTVPHEQVSEDAADWLLQT